MRRLTWASCCSEKVYKVKGSEYANVIFDLDSGPAAAKVQDYLKSLDITYCGRYGDWAYIWTDQSYLSGQRAAQRILDSKTSS